MYIIPFFVIPMSYKSFKLSMQIAKEYKEAGDKTNARYTYGYAIIMINITIATIIFAVLKFGYYALIVLSSTN